MAKQLLIVLEFSWSLKHILRSPTVGTTHLLIITLPTVSASQPLSCSLTLVLCEIEELHKRLEIAKKRQEAEYAACLWHKEEEHYECKKKERRECEEKVWKEGLLELLVLTRCYECYICTILLMLTSF